MKRLLPSLIAMFCLTLFPFSPAAQGQSFFSDDPYWGLRPTIPPELPDLKFSTLLKTVDLPNCPGFKADVGFTYPVNTGSPGADAFYVEMANKRFNEFFETAASSCVGIDTANTVSSLRVTFSATAPGKNYLSTLFTFAAFYAGDARGNEWTETQVLDLFTGRTLRVDDLFYSPMDAIPVLWQTMAKFWCNLGFGELPASYNIPGGNTCTANTPPIPPELTKPRIPFSVLGGVSLTPVGMTIRQDFPFTRVDGPQEITINKSLLIGMGAVERIWE
jgi:hypothetical protein